MTINTADLTLNDFDGTGAFDVLMESAKCHLEREFDENRIRGNDYATAYVALMGAAMQASVQYALQKPTAEQQALQSAAEVTLINQKIATELAQTDSTGLDPLSLIGKQIAVLDEQIAKLQDEQALLTQKKTTEQAQTTDGIAGSSSVIGKQIDLYSKQANGYVVDQAVKAAKLYTDVFSVDMNRNEAIGREASNGLENSDIDAALAKVVAAT